MAMAVLPVVPRNKFMCPLTSLFQTGEGLRQDTPKSITVPGNLSKYGFLLLTDGRPGNLWSNHDSAACSARSPDSVL